MYDEKWWIGLVAQVFDDDAELEVNFLHPSGPSKGFKWPEKTDLLSVTSSDVLCVIDAPVPRNGTAARHDSP